MHVIGDVKDKKVILVDDMIDTAGTLTQAAKACMEHGALEVYASAAHGVLSGPAIERIIESPPIKKVIITDTVPFGKAVSKIEVLSVAPLFAEAITRIYQKESISSLFGKGQV